MKNRVKCKRGKVYGIKKRCGKLSDFNVLLRIGALETCCEVDCSGIEGRRGTCWETYANQEIGLRCDVVRRHTPNYYL